MNAETKKVISIAEKPGDLGVRFHNMGYELLGLNYVYLPLRVFRSQLNNTMGLVRQNFYGCSVSMPHKIDVMKHLDDLDPVAREIGAVNTIVNIEGVLRGHNTDYLGAKISIEQAVGAGKDVLVIGSGGVGRAVAYAARDLRYRLYVANRDEKKSKKLADELNATLVPFAEINELRGYLLVNATEVGMSDDSMIIEEKTLERFEAVMDVIARDTLLLKKANEKGKICIPGKKMAVYQANEQFKIYTGRELPRDFLNRFF